MMKKMRDAFSPIFAVSILLLFIGHGVTIYSQILLPFIWFFLVCALLGYVYRAYILSYICCGLAIALVIMTGFITMKENYMGVCEEKIPQDRYVTLQGKLLDYPEIREKTFLLMLHAWNISWNGKQVSTRERIRIMVQGHCPILHRGDWVKIDAQLSSPELNKNFFKNSYEDYLLGQWIHRRGFSKSAGLVQVLHPTSWGWRMIGRWRQSIRRAIESYYQRADILLREGVFLEAILLGDRGKLDERIEEDLIRSGVLHVIAISGANIGIIEIFCLWIFRFFRLRRSIRYGMTAIVIFLFLVISGFDVSAQRAVSMALMLFAARVFFRDLCVTQVIAFSGLVMLLMNPAYFLDPGFMLTYSLTYALVFGRAIFSPLLQEKIRVIREYAVANLSATLFSFPLSLYYFMRYSFTGFFSGLILVPLSALITAGGLLLLPLAPLSARGCVFLLKAVDSLLKIFFTLNTHFARLRLEIFRPPPSPVLLFSLFFLFALLALARFSRILRQCLLVLGVFLLAIPLMVRHSPNPRYLQVYFLDVGQGDCEAVVFPNGQCLLVDGGGTFYSEFKVGKRLLLPFLLQRGLHVKWVAVTHFHPDHVAGLLDVLPIVKPEEIWISSAPEDNQLYQELCKWAKGKAKLVKASRGFTRKIGDCVVNVLHPDYFIHSQKTANDHSLVIKVSDPYHSFLLTGDIEKESEQCLVKMYGYALGSTVLKVPHHGSRRSADSAFLRAVGPQVAVFSCGIQNSFAFPHPEFSRLLRELRVPRLSTSRRGGICMESMPHRLRISVSK